MLKPRQRQRQRQRQRRSQHRNQRKHCIRRVSRTPMYQLLYSRSTPTVVDHAGMCRVVVQVAGGNEGTKTFLTKQSSHLGVSIKLTFVQFAGVLLRNSLASLSNHVSTFVRKMCTNLVCRCLYNSVFIMYLLVLEHASYSALQLTMIACVYFCVHRCLCEQR